MTNTTTEFDTILVNGQPIDREAFGPAVEIDYGPFCFVCGRCTDHVAEHDDLTEAGVARYVDGGYVEWTDGGRERYMAAILVAPGGQDDMHDQAIAALILERKRSEAARLIAKRKAA
jgi:hypothetical protein